MVQGILLAAGFGVLAAAVYAAVGWSVQQRKVSDPYQRPNSMFALWWYGLGATTGVGALLNIFYVLGARELAAYLVVSMLLLFLICVALWGLLYYLVFLFTGKTRFFLPLGVFYLLYFFLLMYFILAHRPDGIQEMNWSAQVHYAVPVTQDILYQAVVLLLVGPQILSGFALLSFVFRTKGREQRFRIATVGLSMILWFGSALGASVGGFAEQPAWQVISRVIGLGAALAILAAYRPPHPLRLWLSAAPAREPATIDLGRERVQPTRSLPVAQSSPIETAW